MKQFNVFIEDKVGELARVTELLAQNAVNVRGLATDKLGPRAAVKVITDDEASTRRALSRSGFQFEESEVVVLDLIDRPGEISKIARRAAKEGLNINSVFLLGKKGTPVSLALVTDDPEKAKKLLG
jgi:hypothetical protein